MNFIFKSLPIDGPLRITSKFGPRNTGISGASTNHKGIDLGADRAKTKTAILAVADGTISANYWNGYRGWTVTIQHNESYMTLSQHLESQSWLGVGSKVLAGQLIGMMGNSSDKNVLSITTHLHFELYENGVPIDPQGYLLGVGKDVTSGMTQKELEDFIDQRVKERVSESLSGAGAELPNWAKESWKKGTDAGVVDGKNPGGYPTRCQVVQMLKNAGVLRK